MSSTIEISDDDDSIDALQCENTDRSKDSATLLIKEPVNLSDEVISPNSSGIVSFDADTTVISSDDDEDALPVVKISKSNAIKQLFSFKPESIKHETLPTKDKGVVRMIGGVEVCMPVTPYGCQMALMAKVIEAMKKSKNCLLESPTGSGKTLALLCAALACQASEKDRIAKEQAQNLVTLHPELVEVEGVTEFCATPKKKSVAPEELFLRSPFGKSIYYEPKASCSTGDISALKRPEPATSSCCEASPPGLVQIHKKPRLGSEEDLWKESAQSIDAADLQQLQLTPEKTNVNGENPTPEKVRQLYNLVENLQLRTSMHVDCRAPTIYYGARTHKQLEQVIKEFGRTYYAGVARMTLLSSREYSCVREFDRNVWSTKNDMCRGCTKAIKNEHTLNLHKSETNCKYFDNRLALNRKTLPPSFDLEDLVRRGRELNACPYYAARQLQSDADIVFCPYNYLIDPGIRRSLQISLAQNIVIIDEGHNIEDICRDAATFNISRDQIATALQELDKVIEYRFQNQDTMCYVEVIHRALRNWTDWFQNQLALVSRASVSENEAVYKWQMPHFVETLNNHNIGQQQYKEFLECAEVFTRKLMEDPRALVGVSTATGNLIDTIAAALGYLFRDEGRHMHDFKPALVRTLATERDDARQWRTSHFDKSIQKESLTLRLVCLNPGVVFSSLKAASSVLLASGTLTPMDSFSSELDTSFPLKISPPHVISEDRVWIGTLSRGPDGTDLTCNFKSMEQVSTQDAIGDAIVHVCRVTPHGVLGFFPSYSVMNKMMKRWRQTGLWRKLNDIKNIFQESRDVKDHNRIMEEYYSVVEQGQGALLFAVFRGKVSEGMDFRDRQARAVVTIGIPYPNPYDMSVLEKKNYNDRYCRQRPLLSGAAWFQGQAYRALNQAVGRCVRHRGDWGAVLLIDARFTNAQYTAQLSAWVRRFLKSNHHTYDSLVNSSNSLESFMQHMTLKDSEDI